MKSNQYINTLNSRHQKLDYCIQSEANQINPNDRLIRQLKQKKLQIKDSIQLLKLTNAQDSIPSNKDHH